MFNRLLITFVETGVNANLGQRLLSVESYLRAEEMFLVNYSDGLSDAPLPLIIDALEESKAIASLLLVQLPRALTCWRFSPEISALSNSDIWINGGFFVVRKEIFDYMRPGEELVRQSNV